MNLKLLFGELETKKKKTSCGFVSLPDAAARGPQQARDAPKAQVASKATAAANA